jgi:SPP1 gp7 family putative phage head morphogenesis protein
MLANPTDKPILADRTLTADRLKIETKFAQILPRELLAARITPGAKLKVGDRLLTANLETQVKRSIAKIVADNCWGLWLAGMHHGRDHAMKELKMVGHGVAKFALVDDNPPSRMQNKQAEKAIWTRNNILAGNVADTEWLRIQASLKESVQGDIGREELVRSISDTLGGERFVARARAIARTELTFAYNAGRVETYRENNVEAIRRYCIGDERTCEQCAGLNGMVARLDDMAAVMRIFAPSHVSCRCTTGVVLDIRQLAEANRQPPPLPKETWMMGSIVAAIIGG